jgi:uncharacterized protein YhjY with autotransporter beta-barrel domain
MKTKSIVGAVIIGGMFGLAVRPASAFGPISINGVDSNQRQIENAVSKQDDSFGILSSLGFAVTGLPASQQLNALNQLSPEQFHVFASDLAFNNAAFEVTAMDSYLAGQREGADGNFFGGNGRFDVSGLSVSDPDVDSALSVVHSRMLAWNAAPFSNGLLDDSSQSVVGGTDMKDSKDTKAMAPAAYQDPWHFFVRGNVVLAQGFSDQDVSHFDSTTSSVVLGTDYRITPHLLVGLTASFAHTDANLSNTQGSSATVDSYSPGIYAAYADSGWYANFIGDYLHNAYTQDRVITFLGNTATSTPEGNEGVADLDGGYDFHCGTLKYGPLAGVTYTHLTVDGYQESGSPLADLTVQDDQADSLRSRLGAHLSYALTCGGINITPHLEAAWQHEFMEQARGINSSLASGGDFSVVTPNPSRDSAIVDVGVDADINRTVSVFVDYLAQAGQTDYFGQSVQAGVKIGF